MPIPNAVGLEDVPGGYLEAFEQRYPLFRSIAFQAACQAETNGIEEWKEDHRLPNHRGSRAHQQMLQSLGRGLGRLGFHKEVRSYQMRFVTDGYRIATARGRHCDGGTFVVNPRRYATRQLIRNNRVILGLDYSLFPQGTTDKINLWVLTEKREMRVAVFLLLPFELNREGTMLRAHEWREIGTSGELVVPQVMPEEVPPPIGQAVDFEIQHRRQAVV